MIRFILNNQLITTDQPHGMLVLDFVRYHEHLKGTKIGCREGDCGACTVLVGELTEGRLRYRSATSCLTALGNVQGKQVVTVEGLNPPQSLSLNPLQRAICEEGGAQCGFCTPGFIVSMAGFCLAEAEPVIGNAVAAVDGNICRCTGYKSIERALDRVVALLQDRSAGEERIPFLVSKGVLPPSFNDIRQRLQALSPGSDGLLPEQGGHPWALLPEQNGHPGALFREQNGHPGAQFLGGGTDLYVQRHETMPAADIRFLIHGEERRMVMQKGRRCIIGGAATVTDLLESPVIREGFPQFDRYARLISSTPIRNIATVAGNFVNASPIGDLSVFFLAMDARLLLTDGQSTRQLPLQEFYLGYKVLNKRPEEWIEQIIFDLPDTDERCHFEKVSKRTNLDIASVNTAIRIRIKGDGAIGDLIEEAHLAAGGVGPVPAYLARTSAALRGQRLEERLVLDIIELARTEISPISDVRGTAAYKSLLLGQLIKAHFLTLFPVLVGEKMLE